MRQITGLAIVFAALVTAPVGYVWPAWWVVAVAGVIAGILLFFSGRSARNERGLGEYPDRGFDGYAPGPLGARNRVDADSGSADGDSGGD